MLHQIVIVDDKAVCVKEIIITKKKYDNNNKHFVFWILVTLR